MGGKKHVRRCVLGCICVGCFFGGGGVVPVPITTFHLLQPLSVCIIYLLVAVVSVAVGLLAGTKSQVQGRGGPPVPNLCCHNENDRTLGPAAMREVS